ncbi:MAG: cell filamentation protein Fic [Clostridia bacterium]|nr:cell filamentation protein Fic [Clostridia bacterium]
MSENNVPYLSAVEAAKKWGLSERSVRNYCALGRVEGAFLVGKTWNIPAGAEKPDRKRRNDASMALIDVLQAEMEAKRAGGIYNSVLVDLSYASMHMDGSELSHEDVQDLFATGETGSKDIRLSDLAGMLHHFRCVDTVIEHARYPLSENFVYQLYWILTGSLPAYLAGPDDKLPRHKVVAELSAPLYRYSNQTATGLAPLLALHYDLMRKQPFGARTGQVARLVLFKECLTKGLVPVIIADSRKLQYQRALSMWPADQSYLTQLCEAAQKSFRGALDYFGIES